MGPLKKNNRTVICSYQSSENMITKGNGTFVILVGEEKKQRNTPIRDCNNSSPDQISHHHSTQREGKWLNLEKYFLSRLHFQSISWEISSWRLLFIKSLWFNKHYQQAQNIILSLSLPKDTLVSERNIAYLVWELVWKSQ